MNKREIEVRELENGFVLSITRPAPQGAAHISTTDDLFLPTFETLFACIRLYYEENMARAAQYAADITNRAVEPNER